MKVYSFIKVIFLNFRLVLKNWSVAQLVEYRFVKARVPGLSPGGPANNLGVEMKKLLIKETFIVPVWNVNGDSEESINIEFKEGETWKVNQDDPFFWEEDFFVCIMLANNIWMDKIHMNFVELIDENPDQLKFNFKA